MTQCIGPDIFFDVLRQRSDLCGRRTLWAGHHPGTTLGRLARQLGLHRGSLVGAMHDLAARLESVPDRLVQEYRQAPVKHAD